MLLILDGLSCVLIWLLVNYIISSILLGFEVSPRQSRLFLLLVTIDARLRQTQRPQSFPLFYLGVVLHTSTGQSLGLLTLVLERG